MCTSYCVLYTLGTGPPCYGSYNERMHLVQTFPGHPISYLTNQIYSPLCMTRCETTSGQTFRVLCPAQSMGVVECVLGAPLHRNGSFPLFSQAPNLAIYELQKMHNHYVFMSLVTV